MKLEDNLKGLMPDELEKVKIFIDTILPIKNNDRLTNQKYHLKEFTPVCTRCGSSNIVKNGHKNGTQRYKCKTCNKFFSVTTNNILYYSHLSYDKFIKFIKCLRDCNSIFETSKITGLKENEVYYLRIKILSLLHDIFDSSSLKGVIQVDEKYIRISFKGTRSDKMPRKSRYSGSQNLKTGISDEQVCVIVAIDEYDNMCIEIAGNGPASTEMIEGVLGDKVSEGTILVTDSKSSYIKFARNHNLELKQIPKGKHVVDEIYNIADLNSVMNDLEIFLIKFKGLSTRHLQQYLDLFHYRKILKYTIEYLEQNMEMYNEILSQNSNLTEKEVFSIEMPIDVESIYGVEFK